MYADENENRSQKKVKGANSQGNVYRAFEINGFWRAVNVYKTKRAVNIDHNNSNASVFYYVDVRFENISE